MRAFVAAFSLLSLLQSCWAADKVHVLIWDERQPRQSKAYDNFLGNEIAKRLGDESDDFEIRSVWLEDPGQGLVAGNMEWADVIVWWGHVRHSDVSQENAQRVLDYVRDGKLNLIALHSAHWARPFVEAMNWRSVENAKAHLEKMASGKKLTIETVAPPRERTVPIHGSIHTPAVLGYKKSKDEYHGVVHLPYCCFPDYRPDGKSSTLRVKDEHHPIAKDLPATFKVQQTEMYNEPFHVPDPDKVIFEETWELGERFRAGMLWNIGKGKVFYFRPGHETYPVFKQPEMIKVIANACRWLGQD
jgi:trehalose utilization protein